MGTTHCGSSFPPNGQNKYDFLRDETIQAANTGPIARRQMSSVALPYYADATTIPANIPTVKDIESSADLLCNEQRGRRVVGVGQHFVAKYGVAVNLIEGETMLFIRQATSVPVPRIYALFKDPSSRKAYIIMERVEGNTLESEWDSLGHTEKTDITHKLRMSFDELRKLKSPGGYCSIGRRPLSDYIFWTNDTGTSIAGPFDTETQLTSAMIKKYAFNNLPPRKSEFYKRAFPSLFHGHPPVFSHGDFQLKNVMLRKQSRCGKDGQATCEYDPVIIDWEFAGWYPSYWDYFRAVYACGRWNNDWSLWVEKVLDPYYNEWAWMDMLYKELWS